MAESAPLADVPLSYHIAFMPILILALLAASSAYSEQLKAADVAHIACDVPSIKYIGELQSLLSQRAVQAMNLAAASDGKPNAELQRLIDPTASFSSGGGDVGLPLASGVAGAMALAREMKADTYRFFGWDGIPALAQDRCGEQKIVVEFIDTHSGGLFRVAFTFDGGRIISAKGWRRTSQSGPMTPVRQ
ncbi:hypothetical protein EOE18_00655 [Novosphingobium umbonatum]|uniref:Uncharacterized protein n=1 Tax=Novosphingobium umbonatum TaxID=1908524 RepID=A0A3S2UUV7_9SPHN|nr:hypothetical protein [Novosphingobium umbonatum]RVU07634.1 hypothetical protein EOE18_00655 [Novosphingobium umbonatum]